MVEVGVWYASTIKHDFNAIAFKWVAVGSQWKTKPFPPTVHGVLLPSKPNVTIIYQQSGFDKRLKDLFLRFLPQFCNERRQSDYIPRQNGPKLFQAYTKLKLDIYKFEFMWSYRNIKFVRANIGNLLGATADPAPLSTILSSIFIVVLVLFSGFFSATETAFSSVNRTKLK